MGTEILYALSDKYIIAVEYDANNNPIYIGEAQPGTLKSEEGWRIRKIEYDANNNPTDILFAEGSIDFKYVWDDRGSYTYK